MIHEKQFEELFDSLNINCFEEDDSMLTENNSVAFLCEQLKPETIQNMVSYRSRKPIEV